MKETDSNGMFVVAQSSRMQTSEFSSKIWKKKKTEEAVIIMSVLIFCFIWTAYYYLILALFFCICLFALVLLFFSTDFSQEICLTLNSALQPVIVRTL